MIQRLREQRAAVWLFAAWKGWKYRQAGHDQVYGTDYFAMVDETTGRSAGIMAQSIVEQLRPTSVIDMGCGTGNLLAELRDRGVATVGLEYAEAALSYCQQRELDVRPFDFTDSQAMEKPLGEFSLAINMEVALQLPPEAAKRLVKFLCQHSDTVLFSSSPWADDRLPRTPWQVSRWVREFKKHGFALDRPLAERFKQEWQEQGTAPWFYRAPLLFRRLPTQ